MQKEEVQRLKEMALASVSISVKWGSNPAADHALQKCNSGPRTSSGNG